MERPKSARKEYSLKYLPGNSRYSEDRVTSVHVIAFDTSGRILVVKNKRGFDIPGGHREKVDKTLEDTARREALEEGAVTLSDLTPCAVIESNYLGDGAADLTYMVVMTGLIKEALNFKPTKEISERSLMSVSAFLDEYKVDARENMKSMIASAQEILLTDGKLVGAEIVK